MNKSATYSRLYIKVTKIEDSHVYYQLAAIRDQRTFRWTAMTGSDRMTVASLEVGTKYWIDVAPDASGTQHWLRANKFKTEQDEITKAIDKRKAKPQVRDDMLLWDDENYDPLADSKPTASKIAEKFLKSI